MSGDDLTSWRILLLAEMKKHGDSLSTVEFNTMSDADMDERFDHGYGCTEGTPFTVWTPTRVYFPICYDGAEWVGSVSRHPDGKPTKHQGG